ncbi:protein of unknown function [Xenorhabdus doucetiae]|uniref:Uncharacterized protein n=1 Tax=Xenorhabdus doucetiae TaxID=351671 RepID=A0A068QWU9_9GAMM|nr:protein of unknown function [Xenorhabdus doucetiae]
MCQKYYTFISNKITQVRVQNEQENGKIEEIRHFWNEEHARIKNNLPGVRR